MEAIVEMKRASTAVDIIRACRHVRQYASRGVSQLM